MLYVASKKKKKEDFFQNSRILYCFVQLKTVGFCFFNLLRVFDPRQRLNGQTQWDYQFGNRKVLQTGTLKKTENETNQVRPTPVH